jgi:hypothetical protein
MQRNLARCAIGVLAAVLAVSMALAGGKRPQQPQSPTPSATKGPTNLDINDTLVRKISKQIAGHEQEPAAQVFKNIQLDVFKKTPASRLLLIMNLGYSRALGVNCTHCHVEEDFSKDDKRPKRAAREMALMHFSINQQLAKMRELDPNPQGRFINCSTCHRGSVKPKEQ